MKTDCFQDKLLKHITSLTNAAHTNQVFFSLNLYITKNLIGKDSNLCQCMVEFYRKRYKIKENQPNIAVVKKENIEIFIYSALHNYFILLNGL